MLTARKKLESEVREACAPHWGLLVILLTAALCASAFAQAPTAVASATFAPSATIITGSTPPSTAADNPVHVQDLAVKEAWTKLGACSYAMERRDVAKAAAASREIETFLGRLHTTGANQVTPSPQYVPSGPGEVYMRDAGPVFQAHRILGDYLLHELGKDGKTPYSTILSFDPHDRDAVAWSLSVAISSFAYSGNEEEAQAQYDKLQKLLPLHDRRVAVAGYQFAIEEVNAFCEHRRNDLKFVGNAHKLVTKLRSEFPDEKWLAAKALIRLADFHIQYGIDTAHGEKMARAAIALGGESRQLPESYLKLVECLRAEKRYQDSIEAAKRMGQIWPNSDVAAHAIILAAASLRDVGQQAAYLKALDDVIAEFPDTNSARYAANLKASTAPAAAATPPQSKGAGK